MKTLHSDWDLFDEPERNVLTRNFAFSDFKEAWKFMQKVADHADANDHHPEWFNVYNRVEVTLSTHDSGGVTDKDFALAAVMDEAAGGK